MAKLSTIDDVERRKQEPAHGNAGNFESRLERAEERFEADVNMTSEQEEAFHGLDARDPMGTGHKALIVAACIVVLGSILYIVNSWIHFV